MPSRLPTVIKPDGVVVTDKSKMVDHLCAYEDNSGAPACSPSYSCPLSLVQQHQQLIAGVNNGAVGEWVAKSGFQKSESE